MAASVDARKAVPADVARAIVKGVEAGQDEVLADERSREISISLARDRGAFYRTLAGA